KPGREWPRLLRTLACSCFILRACRQPPTAISNRSLWRPVPAREPFDATGICCDRICRRTRILLGMETPGWLLPRQPTAASNPRKCAPARPARAIDEVVPAYRDGRLAQAMRDTDG